jgi:hypothetical protein
MRLGSSILRSRSILGFMPARLARILSLALALFLFAQPIPSVASALAKNSDACCCCGKGKCMRCCRRMHNMAHMKSMGPALSSRDCCSQCQVSVRMNQSFSEPAAPPILSIATALESSYAVARYVLFVSRPFDSALFGRPPPFLS